MTICFTGTVFDFIHRSILTMSYFPMHFLFSNFSLTCLTSVDYNDVEGVMMLINQYQAAKVAGISKQAINEKSKKTPRPGYFKDIQVDGKTIPHVDDDHPEWKLYVEKIKLRQRINGATEEQKEKKLFTVVYHVLKDRLELEQDRLMDILHEIEKKYKEA